MYTDSFVWNCNYKVKWVLFLLLLRTHKATQLQYTETTTYFFCVCETYCWFVLFFQQFSFKLKGSCLASSKQPLNRSQQLLAPYKPLIPNVNKTNWQISNRPTNKRLITTNQWLLTNFTRLFQPITQRPTNISPEARGKLKNTCQGNASFLQEAHWA